MKMNEAGEKAGQYYMISISSYAQVQGEERKKTVTMSSGCMNSVSCVDARAPVRATYVNLYKWPESDAEFVKSVTREKRDRAHFSRTVSGRRRLSQSPGVVDSYSCRQMYLRSYTFSKKETVPEKTKKCLAMVKERASLFAKDSSNASVSSHGSRRSNTKKENDKKKKKKGCVVMVKKIKDASCSAFFSLFRRLLSCTTTVDVIDNHPSQ